MQLSRKQEALSQFFFAFLKSTLNFKDFSKKKTARADVFPQLRAQKNVLK